MREPVSWDELRAVLEAQPQGSGGVATWEALLRQLEVSLVMFSKSQTAEGYRIGAVGFLPAVVVLPRAWRDVLPPVPEAWVIPNTEEEPRA
jgi:hypothetical protein